MKVDKNKLINFFKEKGISNSCPLCRKNELVFTSNNDVFMLKKVEDENLPYTTIKALIPITCENCGNTILIDAKVIGLLEEEDAL